MQFAPAHVVRRLAPGLGLALALCASAAHAQYKTDAWDGKFLYGAYSTLISSQVMGTHYRKLISDLSDPVANKNVIIPQIAELQRTYTGLSEVDAATIVTGAFAHKTPSLFDEQRSIVYTDLQNREFMDKMKTHPELKPVDNYMAGKPLTMQYNTHRGLYNNAYGIPQNSAAAMLNAYIVGIRNVEFDVLETKDHVNIVIHDVVTNREDGSYNKPPIFVKKWNWADIRNTPVKILDPTASVPAADATGVNNLMTTQDLLYAVTAFMPGMTVYADARNYAPVSMFKLLHDHPELKANVVIKIYPFEMGGGVTNLIKEYAVRYKGGDTTQAAAEIQAINANVLLALGGAANETNEEVALATTLNAGANNFNWATYKVWTKNLDFSTDSTQPFKKFEGVDVFSADDLKRIEAKTYLFTRWAMDFAAIANVRVLQTALLPSLASIIGKDDKPAYTALSQDPGDKLLAAVNDNFFNLYQAFYVQKLAVSLTRPTGGNLDLKAAWTNTVFGLSDRYPDFAFGDRTGPSKQVDQTTLNSWNYSMLGVVEKKDTYAAKRMRSTKAMADQITWMNGNNLPVRYATTDLPTDLRTGAMGMLGTGGLPADMQFRPSGMVKATKNPPSIPAWQPEGWSTKLWGDTRKIDPTHFDADLKAINDKIGARNKIARAQTSLTAYYTAPQVLVNLEALAAIGQGAAIYYTTPVPRGAYDPANLKFTQDLVPIDADILRLQRDFADKYHVNADGTPVVGRLTRPILAIPQGNWDH